MNQIEVIIEQGTLRGSTGKDIRGNVFYKFQGIPYARPPVGELRFKAPVPPEKFDGVYDATKERDICYSRDLLKNMEIAGSENCLFLNVYTKKIPDGKNPELKPVMFWIHGGGFIWGHGGEDLYAPDFLITEDVVLVTINYRLGMFGFISFEDPSLDVPGNAGLKDQVMALKWVQKNISKFGGDPNNVTIFGESAGGGSVHLHILSPMSKGLFHKAIAQSGCALSPWVKGSRGVHQIASALNLKDADEKIVYDTLMTKTKKEILDIQTAILDNFRPNQFRPLAAVVEKNSKEPFLTDEPINLLMTGNYNKVPLMIGFTTSEGMVFNLFKHLQPSTIDFESSIPHYFGFESSTSETKIIAERIKKFYFGDEEPSEKNITKKYDLHSDTQFIHGIYLTIITQLKTSKTPIYLYRMSIESELNFFKKLLQITTPGVSHCDDVGYLFKHFATPPIQPGSLEDNALTKFVKLWTNFAKFGNPTPNKDDSVLKANWKPVTGPNLDFLDIDEELTSQTNPEKERIDFWNQIFAESPAGQKLNLSI